jgi:hypothetical protein
MDSKRREVIKFLETQKDKDEKDIIFPEHFTHAMQDYYTFLVKGTSGILEEDYAFSLIEDKFKKEIVEALLLADTTLQDIYGTFGIPVKSLETYKELFFDTSKFISYLDKLSYVEGYPIKFGRELKIRALSLGANFIFFTYGRLTPTTDDQKNLLKRLFLTSAYRAMELNFNGITTTASKNAVELGKLMLKSYEAMEKLLKDDSPIEEDLIKVVTTKTEFTRSKQIGCDITADDLI